MLLNEREWLGFMKNVFGNFVSQSKYEVCFSDLWMYIAIKRVLHFYVDSHLKMTIMIFNVAVKISEIHLRQKCFA